ncbi:hypothetical protein LEP1GSC062_1313 [Leptospira alexanderi serovar Manhao 3 str. L 60]|uniref:Uncharacterized protein n=1 Tax=Leptospira alexanderi serovar Manhao 3 str. L 60 TaxID=1049759 RepID=V6HVT7_9LEPT|nr:hypothetical protein LEP1GSC062_1313 [Leptospira alexanderi serovar Manhao 3 str. L 60]
MKEYKKKNANAIHDIFSQFPNVIFDRNLRGFLRQKFSRE